MSAEYTVVAVNDVKEWKGKHGDFVDYILDLEGHGPQVTLTQKPETPEPARGDVLYGDIQKLERTNRKGEPFTVHKFSKEQREPNGQTATATPSRATPVRDERGARIERQHSQEMALRALDLWHGRDDTFAWTESALRTALKDWTDWFVEDLNKASAAGQVDSLPPGSSEVAGGDTRGEPPAPSQEPQEAVSQPSDGNLSPATREKVTAAYKAYMASAPDGPRAQREFGLFMNANGIEGKSMTEGQASMVLAWLDDVTQRGNDSIPF